MEDILRLLIEQYDLTADQVDAILPILRRRIDDIIQWDIVSEIIAEVIAEEHMEPLL